jgi:iron complex outermembrane receptor protein
MPPYRLGLGLDYDIERLHVGMDATWYGKQDKVAANELPTDGYTLLSIDASYRWKVGQGMLFAFLSGTNLLDEEARQSTSPLKDIVPLPGRGARMGVRFEF